MAIFKISRDQNLLDACIQVYGSAQFLFQFASDNNLAIDADVSAGEELVYDESLGVLQVTRKIDRNDHKVTNNVPLGFFT